MLEVYTDGACQQHGAVGGYSAILLYNGELIKRVFSGNKNTTNNRMELKAAILGLENVPTNIPAILYSDSKYVIDSINNRWIFNWEKNNFIGRKNDDLWRILLDLLRKKVLCKFVWIKGHVGHTYNEMADVWANAGCEIFNSDIDIH